ncbi:hypothetical protein P7C73_g5108, partial [Tremellales sp. Uapishka_1]
MTSQPHPAEADYFLQQQMQSDPHHQHPQPHVPSAHAAHSQQSQQHPNYPHPAVHPPQQHDYLHPPHPVAHHYHTEPHGQSNSVTHSSEEWTSALPPARVNPPRKGRGQRAAHLEDNDYDPSCDSHVRPKPQGRKSRSKVLSSIQINTSHPSPALSSASLASQAPPTIRIKNCKGSLLPVAPGAILEVNDLLILHPPGTNGSTFEMYTCRICAKTYDGKNARSVARRHLADRHGIPLAVQKRRSRWDYEPNRPQSSVEVRERMLKSKRDWAIKNRQQIRLEKLHAIFLEIFGPQGLSTPCGMKLVAPTFRGQSNTEDDSVASSSRMYLNGTVGSVNIPESILMGVAAIRDNAEVASTGVEVDVDFESLLNAVAEADIGRSQEIVEKTKGKGKAKAKKSKKKKEAPYISPRIYSSPRVTATPVSNTRSTREPDEYDIPYQWPEFFDQTDCVATEKVVTLHSYETFGHELEEPFEDTVVAKDDDDSEEEKDIVAEPSVDEVKGPLLQQWVSSEWESGFIAVPAAALEGTSEETENEQAEKEGSVEAVAAESLLNLHSSPTKPSDESQRALMDPFNLSSTPGLTLSQPESMSSSTLPNLDTPRPTRPTRSRSFIQPFARSRPEAATRSLSFSHHHLLDDPFVLSQSPAPAPKARSHLKPLSQSPSPPSSLQKRKDPPSSPFRAPLAKRSLNESHPSMFSTPHHIRPSPGPSSLSSHWLFSSPLNGDAAASLGLAPTHYLPQTPGLRGIIGHDTPGIGPKATQGRGKDIMDERRRGSLPGR